MVGENMKIGRINDAHYHQHTTRAQAHHSGDNPDTRRITAVRVTAFIMILAGIVWAYNVTMLMMMNH